MSSATVLTLKFLAGYTKVSARFVSVVLDLVRQRDRLSDQLGTVTAQRDSLVEELERWVWDSPAKSMERSRALVESVRISQACQQGPDNEEQ